MAEAPVVDLEAHDPSTITQTQAAVLPDPKIQALHVALRTAFTESDSPAPNAAQSAIKPLLDSSNPSPRKSPELTNSPAPITLPTSNPGARSAIPPSISSHAPALTRGPSRSRASSSPPTPTSHASSHSLRTANDIGYDHPLDSQLLQRSKFSVISQRIRDEIRGQHLRQAGRPEEYVRVGTADTLLDGNILMKLVEEHLGELETSTFVARVQSLGLHAIILVLIEISWTATDLKALEKHFVQSDHQTPNKLPLRYEDATEIFGPDRGRSFFNAQFCYAPVTIVKGEHQDIGPLMRVPILYDKEELGRGISGSVRKATFPPGVWQTRNGKLNTENQVVAVKKFDNKEFFEPEKEIYRALQKDGKNNNVVRCLGSLQHETTHGTDYLIFLPLALYNLDTFLNQPYVHPNRPANLFQDAADILDYAAGLACGLRYLHDVLDNEMGQEISVLHGDFKPQNILVYRDKPFIWKISDYGYSKTKPREQGQDDTTAAVREGTFVSPEAHSGRNITVASDLWGMGCVLIEVITYTVGGPDLVQAFRELRNQEGQGHDRFFVTGDEGVCVNPAVTRWCAHLPGIARNKDELLGEVINDVLAFLRDKLLVIDVEERKHTDAQRVRQALFDASRRLKNRDVARHSSQLFDRVRRRGTPLNDPTKRSDNDANPGKSKKHFDRLKRRLRSVFQRILRKAKWGTRKRTEGRNVGDAHVGMHG